MRMPNPYVYGPYVSPPEAATRDRKIILDYFPYMSDDLRDACEKSTMSSDEFLEFVAHLIQHDQGRITSLPIPELGVGTRVTTNNA